jgi:hypothetical protein
MMTTPVEITRLKIDGENFYCISNFDEMRPFFMSIVSDNNHWMFISSNGASYSRYERMLNTHYFPTIPSIKLPNPLIQPEGSLFFRLSNNGETHIWEPFSERNAGLHKTSRNLYKNTLGNKLIFEEINHDFSLTFRYEWNTSGIYGFIRKSSYRK